MPHTAPAFVLASVLQAASFGRAKESQATSTREMDPWKTTRDRFVPASTVLILDFGTTKPRARVAVRGSDCHKTGQDQALEACPQFYNHAVATLDETASKT